MRSPSSGTARSDCRGARGRELGAEQIIAMSRHASRQQVAGDFGATHIVAELGAEGVQAVQELTDGVGADAVLEGVGTNDSMLQAIHSVRPGGLVGCVGVPHGVECRPGSCSSPTSGSTAGRLRCASTCPNCWNGSCTADRTRQGLRPRVAVDDVAEAYRAMDNRHAIKALLRP